jgi:hypothetical protein
MGRIIQQNNGKTTVYVTGENFSSLSPTTNTYFVGVDLTSGSFEKKNPNGSIINLESGTGGTTFTGGTVTGATNFTNGLEANVISATTYLNLPVTQFTGGTVNGATNFSNGLTANTLSSSSVACSGGISAASISSSSVACSGGVSAASISSSSVACSGGVSAGSLSATTYLNLPADIYITGGTYSAGTLTLSRTVLSNIVVTGFTNNAIVTTYSQLVSGILLSELMPGTFYLISDYQTCYDQPDFDYSGSPIINTGITGNYKQGPVEPILVLATSNNTISSDAYQPEYPNDKITYDWSFSATEVTNSAAFGRITERVDEFNNRTDYDHRNILFKRYRLYTYRLDQPLNGTIQITGTGPNNVSGTTTQFTNLSVGDVIYVPGVSPSFYEIINISGDTLMSITGDTLSSFSGLVYYKGIEETNGSGYFSYKRTNVKLNDFIEYTTFGDAISNDYAKNNYIGNYTNNYTNVFPGTFLLPNNVFLEGQYESNKFGDYCYNNTFGTDNQNNVWGDYCYENVSTNDIDDNIIGHYFNNNLLNVNLTSNHIGNDFNNNKLLSENSDDFEDNIIGNGFRGNVIYSRFYKNEILDNFNDNIIGDFGNLDRLVFYRNYIRNNFNNNIIKNNYQNNQIGTNFQDNFINGEFIGNTVLNGFNNNTTGDYFSVNNIGNAFNQNVINDDFRNNTTDYYFYNNKISNEFYFNKIGAFFEDNKPSNETLFGWDDLSTVSTRTYDTFNNSVGGGQLGNRVLGKEFIMFVTSTSQYFKIKFTQWTQGVNNNSYGGGFQYTREEIDSNGSSLGPVITFTKTNYGNEVDVIVPGIIEITRGNQGGIYNVVSESNWNSNLSPSGTTWNSIYTEPINGEQFGYNVIGNNFNNNIIANDFGYGGSSDQGNRIGDRFENNSVGSSMYNNVIGNEFANNTLGDNFENNLIQNYFIGNTISNNFESNEIGNYFGNNGGLVENIIFDNFRYNKIGNFFGNDTNYPTVGGGTNADGGNIINDNFQFNEIGDNFIYNAVDLVFQYNKIGTDAWFNVFGTNTLHNVIGNLFVGNGGFAGFPAPMGNFFVSNKLGNYSAFNFIGNGFQYNKIGDFFGNAGSGGTENDIADSFNNNNIGNYFGDDGSHTSGGNTINNGFTYNTVSDGLNGVNFNLSTLVYDNTMDKNIFRVQGGVYKLSYYDSFAVLQIATNITD